jgi:hypothetical protein
MELGMDVEKCGASDVPNSIRGCNQRYTQGATRAVFKKGEKNLETVPISTR